VSNHVFISGKETMETKNISTFADNKAKFDILLNSIGYTEDEVSAHCISEYQL
jgi:hypothetical protein